MTLFHVWAVGCVLTLVALGAVFRDAPAEAPEPYMLIGMSVVWPITWAIFGACWLLDV